MSQYTPGPWKASGQDFNNPEHDDKLCGIVDSGHEWVIAEVCGDVTEADANARLIAAAPEMYDALQDLLNVIANDELIPESVSYMRQARKVLAKINGGAK